MPGIDFAAYPYYPALQCSFPEQHGFRQLSDEDKNGLLPIFELSQRNYDDGDLVGSVDEIRITTANRPFILDLCKDPCPPPFVPSGKILSDGALAKIEGQKNIKESYNAALTKLLDPADGFSSWRQLVATFPNCVPVLQFTDPATQAKSILRQASMLSSHGSLAVRIPLETDFSIFSTIALVVATLENASSLLIIIDCGQGRTRVSERAEMARKAIATILSEVEVAQRANIRAVCLSNSFPNAGHDNLKEYASCDNDLWEQTLDAFPFMYGDYGAMHRRHNTTMFIPGEWRATVISPSKDGWLIYRDPNSKDPKGWETGCDLIQKDALFVPLDTWGATVIANGAAGKLEDHKSPRFWYAAKVNLHLHQQTNWPSGGGGGGDYLA
jgi:hypothetical protein